MLLAEDGRAVHWARARRRRRSQRLCREISELTRADRWLAWTCEEQVARLNRHADGVGELLLPGAGEQSLPGRGSTHARHRLRQWLCEKHKVQGRGTSRFPDEYLDQTAGPGPTPASDAQLPVGESVSSLSESRMREIRTSGLMSGSVETEHG